MISISSLNIRFNYYYQCDDFKDVYNYIKQNDYDGKTVFSKYSVDMYKINDILKDRNVSVVKLSDKEIIDLFQNSINSELILFEKECSKDLYNYFDNDSNYNVNNEFNSFKIIEKIESA